MSTETVAVLDIGKTNKKINLYDRNFNVLAEERTTVATQERDGIEVEDTDFVLGWFRDALKRLASGYNVRGIAVSGHGATLTLLDENGRLPFPVISYTAARGAEVQEEFYEVFGSREELHKATGTADIGFCNMAKVLYFTKTRLPEVWARCRHSLFYGPFFSYQMTGKMGLEPTFPGNHTYLWDYRKGGFSDVARQLNGDVLFSQPMMKSWDVLGAVTPEFAAQCGLPADCVVTPGIHDSNANFLPYMAKGHKDFLLNSTGTWCVLMRNSETLELTDEEIAAKVFFNQNALGGPVRTSLMTSGLDYDTFSSFTGVPDQSDFDAVRQVLAEKNLFVVPGVMPNATAFPGTPAQIIDGDTVYLAADLQKDGGKPMTAHGQKYRAALNIGLALASAKMLGYCGLGKGAQVFTEGGFAKNAPYCRLLAALRPEQRFALTSVKEGTAFGAGITAWMAATGKGLEEIGVEFEIESRDVPREDFADLEAYKAAFEARVAAAR